SLALPGWKIRRSYAAVARHEERWQLLAPGAKAEAARILAKASCRFEAADDVHELPLFTGEPRVHVHVVANAGIVRFGELRGGAKLADRQLQRNMVGPARLELSEERTVDGGGQVLEFVGEPRALLGLRFFLGLALGPKLRV